MKKLLFVIALMIAFVRPSVNESFGQTGCPGQVMSQEWIECQNYVLHTCTFAPLGQSDICRAVEAQRFIASKRSNQQQQQAQQSQQAGAVPPISAWQCPSTHIIKGNFTTYDGERCIFHVPGGQFYNRTKPEKCYATPQDAIADGCRQSLR